MATDEADLLVLVHTLAGQLHETLLQVEALEHALTSPAVAGVRPSGELLDALAATARLAGALWQRFPIEEPLGE